MNARRMRLQNAQHVLRIVRKHGPMSRAEITRHSRLSAPTVSVLIESLLRSGLLEDRGEGESNGGRKPQLVCFNARCGAVLGANVDRHSIQLVLADMNGGWLEKQELPLHNPRPEAVVARIATAARSLQERQGGSGPLLAAVVGAPGMSNVDTGVVLQAASLDGWRNVELGPKLRNELGGVPVMVENDVNLAAIGEHSHGAAQGIANFVLVALGGGIGAGIVIDGKIYRGHRWYAGEISHLNLEYREWQTDFGAFGYLESFLLGLPHPSTGIATEPRRAGRFTPEAVARLGAAVANVATILDPERIVFSVAASEDHSTLMREVSRVATRIAPNCPELTAPALGTDAPLYGSVQLALTLAHQVLQERILQPPTAVAAHI